MNKDNSHVSRKDGNLERVLVPLQHHGGRTSRVPDLVLEYSWEDQEWSMGFLPAGPGLAGSKVFLCSGESHHHVSEIPEVHLGPCRAENTEVAMSRHGSVENPTWVLYKIKCS